MKEQQPDGITELEQKLDKINIALGKANRVGQTIGTPEFGRPELDISPSSHQLDSNAYLDATIRVGRVRKALTENAIPRLTDLKSQVQGQIDNLKVESEKTEKLQKIRELAGEGYLPVTVFERAKEIAASQKGNDGVLPNTADKDPDSNPFKESSKRTTLTEELAEKLNNKVLGKLPDDTLLKVLHFYREEDNSILAKDGSTQIDGWREYLMTLEARQKIAISNAIGTATRAGIYTVGDVRQLILGRLCPNKSIGKVTFQFLIHAFKEKAIDTEKDQGPSLAVGRTAETSPEDKATLHTQSAGTRKLDADVELLRRQGLRNKQIAAQLGTTLSRIEDSNGRLIAAGRIERLVNPKTSSVKLLRILQVFQTDHPVGAISLSGIASQLGVNRERTRVLYDRLNLTYTLPPKQRGGMNELSQEYLTRLDQEVAHRIGQGMAQNRIAEELCVPLKWVNAVRREGDLTQSIKELQKIDRVELEEQVMRLRNQGLREREIAERLKITRYKVCVLMGQLIEDGKVAKRLQRRSQEEISAFDQQVKELRVLGMSHTDMAKRLGTKIHNIHASLMRSKKSSQ